MSEERDVLIRDFCSSFVLKNPQVMQYLEEVYSIPHDGYPFVAYPGINFSKQGMHSIKFYFSFFRRLTTEEIRKVLPVKNLEKFLHYYAMWTETREYNTLHRGVSFAIKIDQGGEPVYYFHLRTKGTPEGLPERLELTEAEKNGYNGICIEYRPTGQHLKKYYYVYNKGTIAQHAGKAGLLINDQVLRETDRMEYIESEGRDKVALVSNNVALVNDLLQKNCEPQLAAEIGRLRQEGPFIITGPGSAVDGKDHALYFASPVAAHGFIPFDSVKEFFNQYLQYVL